MFLLLVDTLVVSECVSSFPPLFSPLSSSNVLFFVALIEKDLMLAMEVANASKARLPLGAQAHQLYGLLCEQGYGDKDFSVVYEFLTKMMKK